MTRAQKWTDRAISLNNDIACLTNSALKVRDASAFSEAEEEVN